MAPVEYTDPVMVPPLDPGADARVESAIDSIAIVDEELVITGAAGTFTFTGFKQP